MAPAQSAPLLVLFGFLGTRVSADASTVPPRIRNAPVVLLVESRDPTPCDGPYCMDKARVIGVMRNRISTTIPRELVIGREASAPPLPKGRFSIFLARYCSVGSTVWQAYVAGHETGSEWAFRMTSLGPSS